MTVSPMFIPTIWNLKFGLAIRFFFSASSFLMALSCSLFWDITGFPST